MFLLNPRFACRPNSLLQYTCIHLTGWLPSALVDTLMLEHGVCHGQSMTGTSPTTEHHSSSDCGGCSSQIHPSSFHCHCQGKSPGRMIESPRAALCSTFSRDSKKAWYCLLVLAANRLISTDNSQSPSANSKAQGSNCLVQQRELQCTGIEPGGQEQGHPCQKPITFGYSTVEQSLASLFQDEPTYI